jgi:hypothetical protein
MLLARRSLVCVLFASIVTACGGTPAASPDGASAQPSSAPASSAAAAAPTTTASAQASATPPAPASVAPPDASAAAPVASASAAPSAAPEAPLPAVKVENIGMHIGGGPNDAVTKEPIKKSVAPHFDELRRCFAEADDPKKGGTFSIDVLIPADGGKASVTKHKTGIHGRGFTDCVVRVFESIDFLKPRKGKTKVSYGMRFTPE